MATKDRVLIELYVDDQGTVKIAAAKKATEELADAATRGSASSKAAAEDFAGSLMKQLGIYALVIAGAWKLEQAVTGAFKSGIQAVDEYRVRVIGIAATLTDMAASGQGSVEEVFRKNKAFAEDYYRALNLESAKHFATVSEGMTVYNRLVQSGYAPTMLEVGAVMTLADKIKLATQGQNMEVQLNTEIIALMEGQARAQSLLAMELKSRLGPGWADLVEQHKKTGDLLTWLVSLYPGLAVANKEIEGTLTAQLTTTKSLLDLLSISGLGGAYQDIVGWNRAINDYLRTHDELAGQISKAWWNISGAVEGIGGFIGKATLALVDFGAKLDAIAQNPALMVIIGAAVGGLKWGGVGAVVGSATGAMGWLEAYTAREKRLFSGAGPYGEAAETFYEMPKETPPKTENRNRKDQGGGGGGGSSDSALRQLENYINRMKEVSAKAAGESFGALEEWRNKEAASLRRLEEQLGASFEAREALASAYYSKRQALIDKFSESETKRFQESAQKQEKAWLGTLDLQKNLFDQLAGAWPQELGFKQKALDLEIQINRAKSDRNLMDLEHAGWLSKAQADEIRGLEALLAAQKRFNLEMDNSKGLSGWAWSRSKEVEQRDTIKELMGSFEGGLQNAFSSAWQGFLTQDQQSLMQAGKNIFLGLMGELQKRSLTGIFDFAAQALKPAPGGADQQMLKTAQGLQKASVGFNLNTAQFSLAAGGLLLSGAGIATNSQALVMAGTVLQVAGLAIQMYQTLTATTQTGAAAALMESAVALNGAAIALGSAAGASGGGGIFSSIFSVAKFLPVIGPLIPSKHSGDLIAHSGLLVAHSGLLPDERLVKVLTGEPILRREAFAAYQRMGLTFDDLNNARLPAAPVPVAVAGPGGGGRPAGGTGDVHYHDHQENVVKIYAQDSDDVRRFVEKHSNVFFDSQRQPVRNGRQASTFRNINGQGKY